jgi:serine protease
MRQPPSIHLMSALLLVASGAGDAVAAPRDARQPAAPWFRDGERRVSVERLGATRAGAPARAGHALAPVRLRYAGNRVVDAHIDRTAIVQIEPGAEQALADAGVEVVRPLMPSIGLWLVADARGGDGLDVAQRLGARGELDDAGRERRARGVREAIPNLYLRLKPYGAPFTPDDPRLGGQWYFDDLAMTEAWGLSKGDPTTSITVIDNGCDLDHPDLAAKMDPGKDVVDGDDDPTYEPGAQVEAHGTACAGLAAAETDNGEGIAGGCPECRLRCVRLITDVALPLSATIDAFQFALEVNASVVSNSWGYTDPAPVAAVLADAIDNLFDNGRNGKGALVLFAAGNEDREINDDEIGALRGVLNIGAINHIEDPTPFTNRGNSIDLVAPTGTLSTDIVGREGDSPGDYTELFGGTSSACPVAAGIAGLLVSAAPDRTAAELYDVLIRTARPAFYAAPDENGHDPVYGHGIIDPVAALKAVLPVEEPPSPTPPAGEETKSEESEPSGCACATGGTQRGGLEAACAAALTLGLARRRRRRSADSARPSA